MSLRVDTSSWISGALVCGHRGLGVLGSEVPSAGDNGAGYAYNDLSLPADADKEICGRITSWPSAGTLVAYEDTSFTFSGAPDGSYSFDYTLYVDGVSSGSATVTLNVGIASIVLSASAITGGAPTLGAPSLSESAIVDYALTASSLLGSAPALGTPSLSESAIVDYALTASGLTGAAPTLGSPWILSGDELDLPDVVPAVSAVLSPVVARLGAAVIHQATQRLG